MLTFLLASQLIVPVEPIRLDPKPIVSLAIGLAADVGTTHYCLATNPHVIEGNPRYTQAPYTPHQPHYAKMWRDKAIALGVYVAVASVLKWASNHRSMQTPERRELATTARQRNHLTGYVVGAVFTGLAVRNLSRCSGPS